MFATLSIPPIPTLHKNLLGRPAIDPDTLTVLNMRFCPYAQRTILCLNAKEADYKVKKMTIIIMPRRKC